MRHNDFVNDVLIQEFYGIDRGTMAVDSVSITKSGKIYRWTEADGYISAQLSGPSLQAEITRCFGLTHLIAVQPDASVELRRQIMSALRVTARLLRRA
jgi:hypothetical protein